MKLNKELMIRSYSNISFSPERRGEQDFNHYTELLKQDLEELGENQGNYEAKFIDKVMSYYSSLMNCASAMITGPANFNNRRNEKRWGWAENKLEHFEHWRNKYFKAVNRVRTLSPEAELDLIPQEIDMMVSKKEKYLEIKKCKTLEERGQLVGLFFPKLDNWDREYLIDKGVTFQDDSLTRRILARKKKLVIMKARIEAKNEQKPIRFKGGSIYIENDRVIIAHDEKPEKEIIQAIKSNGFRWSPKMGNWCRKHTANARYSANLLLKNTLGGEI